MEIHVLAFSVRAKVTQKEREKLKKKNSPSEISHLPTFSTYSLAKPENEQKLEYGSEDKQGIILPLFVLYFLTQL